MRTLRKEFFELNTLRRLILFGLATLFLCTLTGCGEEAVKVIVVPVAAGGAGLFFWLFMVLLFGGAIDSCGRKTITPDQVPAAAPAAPAAPAASEAAPDASPAAPAAAATPEAFPERSSSEAPIADPADETTPVDDRPNRRMQMTRNIEVDYPNFIPPGSRIEVWVLENGEETRPLPLISCNQSYGRLQMNLGVEVPQDIQVRIVVHPPDRREMFPPPDQMRRRRYWN